MKLLFLDYNSLLFWKLSVPWVMHDPNIRYFSQKLDDLDVKFDLISNNFFFNDQKSFSYAVASYFRMHSKVSSW